MNKTTFEKIIEKDGKLIYTNRGDSMMPLIKEGRDLIIIEKPVGRLKKYDVPLYKRDSGQYVLHRVLKVRDDDYVICGDNRTNLEYGISDRHIIGVLTSVVRNGKEISVNNWKYKVYVHVWCDLFPLRVFVLKVLQVLRKLKWMKRKHEK